LTFYEESNTAKYFKMAKSAYLDYNLSNKVKFGDKEYHVKSRKYFWGKTDTSYFSVILLSDFIEPVGWRLSLVETRYRMQFSGLADLFFAVKNPKQVPESVNRVFEETLGRSIVLAF